MVMVKKIIPKKILSSKTLPVKQKTTIKIGADWKQSAIDLITSFEGFRSKAYPDNKQYSNGFGTKAKSSTEVITKDVARKRLDNKLESIYKIVDTNCLNDNQKIAMTSYMYNVGSYAMGINKYIKICSIKDIRYIMSVYGWSSNGKRLGGLVKRRTKEIYIFNK